MIGKLFQFDLGNGKSVFIAGHDPVSAYHDPDRLAFRGKAGMQTPNVVGEWDVEFLESIGVLAEIFFAAEIIKVNGLYGVLLRDKVFGMQNCRFGVPSFPCIYDEIKIPDNRRIINQLAGNCGFMLVSKDGNWAPLLLAEQRGGGQVVSREASPFVFTTADEAEKWMKGQADSFSVVKTFGDEFALPKHG